MTTTSDTHQVKSRSIRKVAIASVIGTTIEWYDIFIFATASALVFNKVFFPDFDPIIGTLLAFGTFASAYVARLAGAVIFGHFGDRVGRRTILLVSLTIMGAATFAIGLLPSYEAIGVWAPILLLTLRIIQGLAVGGEWGGAVLMVVEHADARRRGFAGALVQIGVPLGTLLANGAFLAFAGLSSENMLAWGWRIPFLASVVLFGFGIYIRMAVTESPEFERLRKEQTRASLPVAEVLRKYPLQTFLGGIAAMAAGVIFNVMISTGLAYGTTVLGIDRASMLAIVLAACALAVILVPVFGHLSDGGRRKPVLIGGLVGSGVLAFPFFWLMDTGIVGLALIGYLLLMTAFAANYGPLATFLAEQFGIRVRYSGLSIAYMLAGLLGSALTPVITTALLAATGEAASIAWYVAGASILSIIATLLLRENRNWAGPDGVDDELTPTVTSTVSSSKDRD